MIKLGNSCCDSILLCLTEISDDGFGLEVTQLVAERSHGHGMNDMSNKGSTDVEGHAVLRIKPRSGAMLVLRGTA